MALLFLIFFFLICSTFISWLLSKKVSRIWFINKFVVGIGLFFAIALTSTILTNNYLSSSSPEAIFHRAFGFDPPRGVWHLRGSSIEKGDEERTELTFSADKETFDKILGGCYIESRAPWTGGYMKLPPGNSETLYYKRFNRNVDSEPEHYGKGCDEKLPMSYIAYDPPNGEVRVYWICLSCKVF
jgi:hypothetical protein